MGVLYDLGIRLFYLLAKIKALSDPKTKKWVTAQNNIIYKNQKTSESRKIWMHCASLGEFESIKFLIDQISGIEIIVSFFSPSGYEAVSKKYKEIEIQYLPLDTGKNADKFINSIKPICLIISESDLWYNHICTAQKKEIPIIMVSSSFRKDQFMFSSLGSKFRLKAQKINRIFTKDMASQEFLGAFGFKNSEFVGDLRVDRILDRKSRSKSLAQISEFCFGEEKILLGASLHPTDLILISNVFHLSDFTKLILVPHDVADFEYENVKSLFEIEMAKYSEIEENPHKLTNILWVDQFGLLFDIYKYVDFAFVGGGFDTGVHNVIEPLVFNKPVAFGPNFEKFSLVKDLVAEGLAKSVKNKEELNHLLYDSSFGENQVVFEQKAKKFIDKNSGSTKRVLQYLKQQKII